VSPDDDLADAMFLHAHPGWTWRALQETPAQIVEYVRRIDYAVAKRAAKQ
jgi:hypothetical protein